MCIRKVHQTKIHLIQGDITKQNVEAIVNSANTFLLGGGGVDGAIHRAAGPELLAECRTLGGCETGQAKITRGYNLAKYVIHAVGPQWQGGHHGEAPLLKSAYRSVFSLTAEKQIRSIALPAISCGVYGYPIAQATQIAIEIAWEWVHSSVEHALEEIDFVCFDPTVYAVYNTALKERLDGDAHALRP